MVVSNLVLIFKIYHSIPTREISNLDKFLNAEFKTFAECQTFAGCQKKV